MDFSSLSITMQGSWIVGVIVCLYFVFIFTVGMRFSKFNSNISDFFYSGRRLSWWLPTISMVATGIGSYSYLKYSEQGFQTGMSSSNAYFNDWFLFPIFLFAWLPILYFNRIKSIPEYFEKRFNSLARYLSVLIILAYLFFYIGFNLFTIGVAFQGIFNIHPLFSLPVIVLLLGLYVSFGGQTAVILTDLFQGLMLYVVGFLVVGFGIYALGGMGELWSYLPQSHRLPLAPLNSDPLFNTVGMLWGDSLAGSVAFLYMNQGFIMRFLTIRSVPQIRKAGLVNIAITLPTSALIVGGAGWVATSILSKQTAIGGALEGYQLLDIPNSYHTFLLTAHAVVQQNQWIMGFIYATLLAALMSTVDSLITAVSAIGIYDIYKPLIKPKASERHYLKMARITAIASTLIGLLLVVWFFKQKGTLMSIHYKGVMLIAPPIVTTVFIGLLWKKFHAFSACVAMIVGSLAMAISLIYPEPVYWLRTMLMGASGEDLVFFRAPFGILITAFTVYIVQMIFPNGVKSFQTEKKSIPILSSFLSLLQKGSDKDVSSLTVDTVHEAMVKYKGGEPNQTPSQSVRNLRWTIHSQLEGNDITLSQNICDQLNAHIGDLIYVSDQRWYLGGLRSGHFRLKFISEDSENEVQISTDGSQRAYLLSKKPIFLERTI